MSTLGTSENLPPRRPRNKDTSMRNWLLGLGALVLLGVVVAVLLGNDADDDPAPTVTVTSVQPTSTTTTGTATATQLVTGAVVHTTDTHVIKDRGVMRTIRSTHPVTVSAVAP